MTEEDAKKKECPQHLLMMVIMQTQAVKGGASEDAIKEMGKFGYCSGSDCMMWVGNIDSYKDGSGNPTNGHCGLAK